MLARIVTLASTLAAAAALLVAAPDGLIRADSDTHGDAVSAVAMGHGAAISHLAHTTTATGAARGDVISDAAQAHGTAVRAVARGTGDEEKTAATGRSAAFGQRVSALAKSTTLTGAAKGEAISTLARTHGAAMRAAHR